MNMQNLMYQAKKLQTELEITTKNIEKTLFKYENENIIVEINGKNELKQIKIINNELLKDNEILEDVITVAINNVLDQIKNEKEKKLGKYTNGLGGLF